MLFFIFILLLRLSSFVKSQFTDLSKTIFLLALKKHNLVDHCHFLMIQRSINENNIFSQFLFLLNLILRYCTRARISFVTSESKKYFLQLCINRINLVLHIVGFQKIKNHKLQTVFLQIFFLLFICWQGIAVL